MPEPLIHLINYQNFNSRINRLAPAFLLMTPLLLERFSIPADTIEVFLGDSIHIITCSHKRKAKVARNGYCATKKLHYYGVKLHSLNLRNTGKTSIT